MAFIGHPLNISTLSIIFGWPRFIFDWFGKNNVKKLLEAKRPFIFLRIRGMQSACGASVDFISVACPFLPDQMVSLGTDVVLERIVQAVETAKRDGAAVAVLGGFTSVVGNEGEEVAARVKDIAVTSGNTFTAALAIQGVLKAAEIVDLDMERSRCAILGATGDIGSACARFFAGKAGSLVLHARNGERLYRLASELSEGSGRPVTVETKTQKAVEHADIVISATSALTTIIEAKNLKKGAIVCDVALPANIAREVSRLREDVLVFEGGLSIMPFFERIRDKKWNELMPRNAIYGCLAEGLLLGFESCFENFSIGRGHISLEKIDRISRMASKHGFGLSRFFCGDKFYSEEDIRRIKEAVKERGDFVGYEEGRAYVANR